MQASGSVGDGRQLDKHEAEKYKMSWYWVRRGAQCSFCFADSLTGTATSDIFHFDAAEPPSTPSPPSSLHRHDTSRFHHLSSPQSLTFLSQDDAFILRASGKPHNPTDHRHLQERQRPDVEPDQGLTKWWRTPAKRRFWRNNAGCFPLSSWLSTTL